MMRCVSLGGLGKHDGKYQFSEDPRGLESIICMSAV